MTLISKLLSMLDKEPLYHSHISDGLPKLHRLAQEEVFCDTCGNMVHCFNNECMVSWFEFDDRNVCIDCYFDE